MRTATLPRVDSPISLAGFLNVDKPGGWTSSDVVAKLRAAFGLKARGVKIGHGGTLDPMATGVLPVCVGQATRFSEFLLGDDKTYEITLRLGIETDTYDADGSVVEENDPSSVDECAFRSALARFAGEFDQVPPMFSAIKVKGQPLYRIARSGKTVKRTPRRVRTDAVELTRWEPPFAEIRVECGAGFYARSLAHDLGEVVGCGAHVTSLRRTRAGVFEAQESLGLDSLLACADDDEWRRFLYPVDHVILGLQRAVVCGDGAMDFSHGRAVGAYAPRDIDGDRGPVRVYGPNDEFLGLAQVDVTNTRLLPRRVINR